MSELVVRDGTPDDFIDVMRILDAGLLEVEADEIRATLDSSDCLVAEATGRVAGVLVLDGDFIDAVAVAPSRRGRGVGTVLVEAACSRRGRLVAEFDAGVRPFYESLGFVIERDESRFRGTLSE